MSIGDFGMRISARYTLSAVRYFRLVSTGIGAVVGYNLAKVPARMAAVNNH
jgi:hypothetical protein